MLSGILTSDNLSQVLRDISQRRRQGVLEIASGDKKQNVYFIQGRIVEVLSEGVSAAMEVAGILENAGFLTTDPGVVFSSYRDVLMALHKEARAGVSVDEESFRRVIKHRVLNRLYELDLNGGSYYTFKAEMVEAERDFLPSISVGQLLLDIVALRSDGERFQGLFAGEKRIIGEPIPEGTAFSEEEEVIYKLLGDGISLPYLVGKSMLSRFHIQDTLLAMHDRGLIRVVEEQDLSSALREELSSSIDSAIDRVFDESSASNASASHLQPLVTREQSLAQEEAKRQAKHGAQEQQIKARLGVYSSQLLASPWGPRLVLVTFILCALLAPLLVWDHVFENF